MVPHRFGGVRFHGVRADIGSHGWNRPAALDRAEDWSAIRAEGRSAPPATEDRVRAPARTRSRRSTTDWNIVLAVTRGEGTAIQQERYDLGPDV